MVSSAEWYMKGAGSMSRTTFSKSDKDARSLTW
jgi:hypothetical protein